jgi:hypothetical protein
MEDVASGGHAAIVKRDWGALQPLLHPYWHWVPLQDRNGLYSVAVVADGVCGSSGDGLTPGQQPRHSPGPLQPVQLDLLFTAGNSWCVARIWHRRPTAIKVVSSGAPTWLSPRQAAR